MNNVQKDVQTKLTKGLLDLVVLQLLENQPMHGYQIITTIRKSFGVYLGPSTVYPLLSTLEEKGYVKSKWDMENERPRKVYDLTNDGKTVLTFTANSLMMICRNMKTEARADLEVRTANLENNHTQKRPSKLQVFVK